VYDKKHNKIYNDEFEEIKIKDEKIDDDEKIYDE
jgi:hypothetical protein